MAYFEQNVQKQIKFTNSSISRRK